MFSVHGHLRRAWRVASCIPLSFAALQHFFLTALQHVFLTALQRVFLIALQRSGGSQKDTLQRGAKRLSREARTCKARSASKPGLAFKWVDAHARVRPEGRCSSTASASGTCGRACAPRSGRQVPSKCNATCRNGVHSATCCNGADSTSRHATECVAERRFGRRLTADCKVSDVARCMTHAPWWERRDA